MSGSGARHRLLLRIERWLLAASLTIGVWSGAILLQARHVNNLPVPPAMPGSERIPAHRAVQAGDWVARLDAPSVGLSATILEGSGDDVLARAAGHIEDTAMPGDIGNVGIAGHRDTTFRAFRNIKVGDPLLLTTADRTLVYRITSTFVVDPEDVWVLDPSGGQVLTLVTCYPFTFIGHAPHRFIVKAELVSTLKPEA